MRIAIIGAGLAGLACAGRLANAGHLVSLFDKGRGVGGRMASRRVPTASGEASFDHGAQYFTARDPAFRSEAGRWAGLGLAAPWPAAGPDAWVGTPAMNAPLRFLAGALDVRWQSRVESLSRHGEGWRLHGQGIGDACFDLALLALPAEQAAPLLSPWDGAMASRAAATASQPCWTVMAAFDAPVRGAPDVLREAGPIGWAARNSAKPGRTGPEAWVIQAGPAWSGEHLEQTPEAVVPQLLQAFAARVAEPLPGLLAAVAHRWRYARSGAAGEGALWDPARGLGACGDWLLGPRVECAWLSGRQLAEQVVAHGTRAAQVPPRAEPH